MPSFRAQLEIKGLRPGHRPEAVMDTAMEVLATRHHVEANQVDLVGGIPRITLRFTVDEGQWAAENRAARESASMMREAVEQVAATGRLAVLRRVRGKWTAV